MRIMLLLSCVLIRPVLLFALVDMLQLWQIDLQTNQPTQIDVPVHVAMITGDRPSQDKVARHAGSSCTQFCHRCTLSAKEASTVGARFNVMTNCRRKQLHDSISGHMATCPTTAAVKQITTMTGCSGGPVCCIALVKAPDLYFYRSELLFSCSSHFLGINAQAVLEGLSFDCVLQTPVDYAHLLWYGWVKNLTHSVVMRCLNPRGRFLVNARMRSFPYPRGATRITFNLDEKLGKSFSMAQYGCFLFMLTYVFKGLISDDIMKAFLLLQDFCIAVRQGNPSEAQINSLMPKARYELYSVRNVFSYI